MIVLIWMHISCEQWQPARQLKPVMVCFLSGHRSAKTCWRCRYVRHVHKYECMWYVVHIVCNVHARVMEAENSITLTIYTSENIFIVLGNDCGFS